MRHVLWFLGAAAVGCAAGDDPVADLFGDPAAWIDLTYAYNARTIYWPTAEPFALDTVSAGPAPGGYYYAAFNFRAAEHGGTHLDAPMHFAEGRESTDQVPLRRLIGAAAVIDVSRQAAQDPDYLVSVADLEAWEVAHGRLAGGVILLVRTGWGARWPDPARYLGTDRRGAAAVPLLHFPGIDPAAARWLVAERRIAAVGIDTPSLDYGQSATFDTHRVLYAENIPGFENVANLDRLPAVGSYVVALPMKIAGGSGGPLRIVAAIPEP